MCRPVSEDPLGASINFCLWKRWKTLSMKDDLNSWNPFVNTNTNKVIHPITALILLNVLVFPSFSPHSSYSMK